MNIVLVNLLAFVILSLCFGYVPFLRHHVSTIAVFIMSILSIIPLAYYIGMAISSISVRPRTVVCRFVRLTTSTRHKVPTQLVLFSTLRLARSLSFFSTSLPCARA